MARKNSSLTRKRGGERIIDKGLLSLAFKADINALTEAMDGDLDAFGQAATAAVRDASESALEKGRANIRAAGFPSNWVNALQTKAYPKRGKASNNPVTFVNFRFGGVGSVFEFGATIVPKNREKWLWIPANPKKVVFTNGIRKSIASTPAKLWGSAKGLKFAIVGGRPALVQKNTKAKTPKVMFWGVKRVTVPKKWSVMPIIEAEAVKLPGLIDKNLDRILGARGG